MLTAFNRAELTIALTLEEYSRIRDILVRAGIPYTCKAVDATGAGGPGRSRRSGSLGINQDARLMYRFFVHRDDLEKARYLIRR